MESTGFIVHLILTVRLNIPRPDSDNRKRQCVRTVAFCFPVKWSIRHRSRELAEPTLSNARSQSIERTMTSTICFDSGAKEEAKFSSARQNDAWNIDDIAGPDGWYAGMHRQRQQRQRRRRRKTLIGDYQITNSISTFDRSPGAIMRPEPHAAQHQFWSTGGEWKDDAALATERKTLNVGASALEKWVKVYR